MNPQITNIKTSFDENYSSIRNKSLVKKPFIKSKTKGSKNSAGRNSFGKIVSYHTGGGHKKKYREIEYARLTDSTGIVTTIEYDPNRSCNIASIYELKTKNYYYILSVKNLQVGDVLKSGLNAQPKLGHCLSISKIPIGSYVHNVSLKRKRGGQIARSAGTHVKLIEKNSIYGLIKLPSGKLKKVSSDCNATFGIVSNELHCIAIIGKAGRSRWLNRRPIVRGVAMNPIDHPHGGGEGKKSGFRVSPWGKSTSKRNVKI